MTAWLRSVEIRGDECHFPDRYPFNIPSLQGRQRLNLERPVTFFVGENGSGKSTLVRAMAQACGLNTWGHSERHPRPDRLPATALAQYLHVELGSGPVVGSLFSAETFNNWAEYLDDVIEADPGQVKYYGCTGLTNRSHGESILAYLKGRHGSPGLYFLDEPESALSPASQLALLQLLRGFQESGRTQFFIATHSPLLMALPDSQIFQLLDTGIEETTYQSTAHLQLYRDFLANPRSFL